MTWRFTIAVAALPMVLAVFSGSAMADQCSDKKVVQSGGEKRTLTFARHSARDNWVTKVRNSKEFGKKWSRFHLAKDTAYQCREVEGGKHVCKAEGRPCKSLSGVVGPHKECSIYVYEGVGEPAPLEAWAKHLARKAWKAKVRDWIGEEFDTWTLANNKKTECSKTEDGKYKCKVSAKACAFKLL